jgi:hypothetical protein
MTSEHVSDWLGAYMDGEVRASERQCIEAHLILCAECRAELEALTQLSRRLQESPLPEPATPAGRFAAQVALRLPPRMAKRPSQIGWGLVLLGVVFTLGTHQIMTGLGTLLSLGSQSGLLKDLSNTLIISPPNSIWLSILTFFLQGGAERNHMLLQVLYQWDSWLGPLANSLAWQGRIAILYWAGLLLWWIHRTRETSPGIPSSNWF